MFWALFFYFFYSSSFKYNCLVQDYGRVLYTIVLFLQVKGFLDVGRPPFLRFYEHLLFSYRVWIHTFPALCMKFSLPRLEYGGEFLLHHQDRAN